jgi:V/A-type H+/Na+-transporting ATPase subunit D
MIGKTIQPTRAELLALKRTIQVAEKGHRLLKLKRDVLILELIRIAKEARRVNLVLEEHYQGALDTISIAQMMEGSLGLAIVAISVEDSPELFRSFRNVMGMRLPVFEARGVQKDLAVRGYSLLSTSSVIDEAAEAFEDLTTLIISHAAQLAAIRILTDEITRLKRRVNALEFMLIPELYRERDAMIMQRDELEREELSRIFWVKRRKGNRS